MKERMDDALACVATLTGKTLEEVYEAAFSNGYPKHGPAYPSEALLAKLLMSLGGLVATKYQDFVSFAALPAVAILLIDWDDEMEVGRTVVWHHVKGTDAQTAFNYIVDPASWVDPSHHYRTDVQSLNISWFMEITASGSAVSFTNSRRKK
jgi:hypothetical protein